MSRRIPQIANTARQSEDTNRKKALDYLANAVFDYKKSRYGKVPGYALYRPKYSDTTANGLTQCVMDYLRLMGHHCSRVNTTGTYRKDLGKYVYSGATKGAADLTAVINGRHISIEIKANRDVLSDAQKRQMESVQQSGGVWITVKTFHTFLKWYQDHLRHEARIGESVMDYTKANSGTENGGNISIGGITGGSTNENE